MDKTNYNLFIHWIFCSLKVIYEFKQCDRKLYFHSFNIKTTILNSALLKYTLRNIIIYSGIRFYGLKSLDFYIFKFKFPAS